MENPRRRREAGEDDGQGESAAEATSAASSRARVSEMEFPAFTASEEPSTSWDWGDLLDFAVDEPFILSWDSDEQIEASPSVSDMSAPVRVRKRDPRLTCENFLAGRIPCACPELDAQDEEEEVVGRKRVRTVAGGGARCQVPGCEVDITELKGYHRRHRVCLRCANATSVVIDGEDKRYCQQCGKFHLLPDFDEGKRSCRRKLERHNNRRRRKASDVKSAAENENVGNLLSSDVFREDTAAKETLGGVSSATENLFISSQMLEEAESLIESEDGRKSPLIADFRHTKGTNDASIAGSVVTQVKEGKINAKSAISSTGAKKDAYSSVCPTGRISFKLFDWNPAEFPRRLRLQIFQWLSSMPVELEGYIRPGCTIFTVFLAMPTFMWDKLSDDGASYLKALVHAPESLLSRRGPMIVYLNNMMYQVLNDGTSLMSVKMEIRVPRLHYVHPNWFEAGKPMVFVACGSNLIQPKFRFLVSFEGKYLACDPCTAIPKGDAGFCGENKGECVEHSDHQMLRICIPDTELELFGPAFIEVENEFGLSNFIPILIGNKQICSELCVIDRQFDESLGSRIDFADASQESSDLCKLLGSKNKISDLLLDVGWFLREHKFDESETSFSLSKFQRLNNLLPILIQNEAVAILETILQTPMILKGAECWSVSADEGCEDEKRQLLNYINLARDIIDMKPKLDGSVVSELGVSATEVLLPHGDTPCEMRCATQDPKLGAEEPVMISAAIQGRSTLPLINKDFVTVTNCNPCGMKGSDWRNPILSCTVKRNRFVVFTLAIFLVCCGLCLAYSHPKRISELALVVKKHLCLKPGR